MFIVLDVTKCLRSTPHDFYETSPSHINQHISGGAKSFKLSTTMAHDFQQGLMKAAKATDAWIITGGNNCVRKTVNFENSKF